MDNINVLFLHGWNSVPGGVKPTFLAANGCQVNNPALPDDDFHQALAVAQREYDEHPPDVIVGSSRGGAAAMNLRSGETPLVLLCPAWRKWGAVRSCRQNTIVLHSPRDETIPFADSQELIRRSELPSAALVPTGDDHRLADDSSLAAMLAACRKLAGAPYFLRAAPILRIFDVAKAKEFYLDYLGFTLDWEHAFDDHSPRYLQVARAGLALHLSEHYGDCCPGSTVFVWMTGIERFHRELTSREYKHLRPGLETTFYGARCVEVTDPFGNRIRFNERIEPAA